MQSTAFTEHAFLISVELDRRHQRSSETPWPLDEEARELRELAVSSGCRIAGELQVRRHRPIPGTFLGSGKLDEIAAQAAATCAEVVIFNQELSPAQQRNIEEAVGVKTIDRAQLILDIFAQRARSQEGKVQVELAQLQYLLPRLVGKGIMLSRLGGGIGTRGPGEQKLEVDRRRIRMRVTRLTRELEKLGRRRGTVRARRKESEVPVVALVGYTNAGKTTLLNRLTQAGATAKHQLFTTLDPLARRVKLPGGEAIVLTDTVGFLHHLPHHLIDAFKATLEEAQDADVILHVLDASHPQALQFARTVEEVLKSLELSAKHTITVLNKRDLIADPLQLKVLERAYSPAVSISAKTGEGIDALLQAVDERLSETLIAPTQLRVPADRQDLIAAIYQAGQVVSRKDTERGTLIAARLPGKLKGELSPYILT